MPDPCELSGACLVPTLETRLDEIIAKLDNLSSAFPENHRGEADVDGHRQYHEAKIAAAQAEKEFWTELKLDLAKKGAWLVLLVVLGLLLTGAATKLGIPK